MTQFNLENYETVKERKQRFYKDYPDGRLVTEIVLLEKDHVVIKGIVYKNKEDQLDKCPFGVGHAEEFQGQGGFANKFAWLENCDESAIGRALDQAGYAGNCKCSQEEMMKVENKQTTNNFSHRTEEVKMPVNKPVVNNSQKKIDGIDFNVVAKKIKEITTIEDLDKYVLTLTPTEIQLKNFNKMVESRKRDLVSIGTIIKNDSLKFENQNPFED